MSSVDYSSVCTSNGDWSGELDRVDEIIDAVGGTERGAGVACMVQAANEGK